MDTDLKGRVAIVTGATAGVGKGIATALAANGARTAIVARRPELVRETVAEFSAQYGEDRILGIVSDVSTAEGAEKIVAETVARWGTVDILINSAGEPAHDPFEQNDDDKWHYDFDLKVMAAVRLSRLAIPYMKKSGDGRIVNITAWGGKTPRAGSTPTCVTRAGGLALTKVLSKEFAADGVKVNAMVLGFMKSDQWRRHWEKTGGPGDTLDEFYVEASKKVGIPLGHFGDPRELGDVITFLVSDRGRYISGAAINFDGGLCDVL